MQSTVIAKFAIGVADGDGIAEQAARVIAKHAWVGWRAGLQIGHIKANIGYFPTGSGIDRLTPTVMLFQRHAAALEKVVIAAQLDKINRIGLAEDFLLVAVAPIGGLNGPPGAPQRKMEIGFVLMVLDGDL